MLDECCCERAFHVVAPPWYVLRCVPRAALQFAVRPPVLPNSRRPAVLFKGEVFELAPVGAAASKTIPGEDEK